MSSRGRERYPPDAKVFVGNLSQNTNRYELEDAFRDYGHVLNVWVARNPPGFAFIQYGDKRDAEDAIRSLNNRTVCGRRIHVALSEENPERRGPRGRGRGRDISNEKCYECGKRGHFARDCYERRARGGQRRSRSRSRSRTPPRYRNRSRSRSRSPKRKNRSRSRSASRSRSRSQDRKD